MIKLSSFLLVVSVRRSSGMVSKPSRVRDAAHRFVGHQEHPTAVAGRTSTDSVFQPSGLPECSQYGSSAITSQQDPTLSSEQADWPGIPAAPGTSAAGQPSGPVLRLESAYFASLSSVRHFRQFNYFLTDAASLRCIDLGRRSGTRRNRCSHLLKNSFGLRQQMQSILTGFDEALWNW
jgi:hypothetical protein